MKPEQLVILARAYLIFLFANLLGLALETESLYGWMLLGAIGSCIFAVLVATWGEADAADR